MSRILLYMVRQTLSLDGQMGFFVQIFDFCLITEHAEHAESGTANSRSVRGGPTREAGAQRGAPLSPALSPSDGAREEDERLRQDVEKGRRRPKDVGRG